MAKNNDSFDMDQWSKKKSKPAKKEKDSFSEGNEKEFKIKESSDFDFKVKKEKAPKEPRAPKIKEDKETSFEVKEKKQKAFKEPKETSFDTEKKSGFKKSKKSDDFNAFDEPKEKKQFKFDLKDKKTRTIFISVIAAVLVLAIGLTVFLIFRNKNNYITQVYVSEFPKLSYLVGQEADYTGLSLAIVKANGKSEYIKYDKENAGDFVITGFDSSKACEDQIITINYGGFSCIYHIIIKEPEKPKPALVGISMYKLPNKTEYNIKNGEWFDSEGGMILLEYSDGTSSRTVLINEYIREKDWKAALEGEPGTYPITVRYKDKESGVILTTTFEITTVE